MEFFEQKPSAEAKEETPAKTAETPKKIKKLKRNMFSRAALRD